LNRRRHYIDVFNRGATPFEAGFAADSPWIVLSAARVMVEKDRRLWVDVDWEKAPVGASKGTVKISGAGASVEVRVAALKPAEPTRESLRGFAECEGYVSIEAEHVSRNLAAGARRWIRIEGYGHTLSAMRAEGPVDAPPASPGKDSPCLQYDMYLFSSGALAVNAVLSPTLNFLDGRPLRYAVSIDGEPSRTVTAVPADFSAQNGNREWEKTVSDNMRICSTGHAVEAAGYHTLKIWMVDPGVVVQKLVVDAGGLRPSYLGPPESYRGGAGTR